MKDNGGSFSAVLSANGNRVAFDSVATNLDPADADASLDMYPKRPRRVCEQQPLRPCAVALAVSLCVLMLAAPRAPAQSASPSSSGAYATSVPIAVPPYYGLEPDLHLSYDSQGGAGAAGVGWTLSGFSIIERESDLRGAPSYESSDVYTLDGMRLVACSPMLSSPGCESPSAFGRDSYATFIETYRRIEFDPARRTWQVWDRDGTRTTYEPDRYRFPQDPSDAIQRWRVSRVEDTLGHVVDYTYLHAHGDHGEDLQASYPLLVTYGRTGPSAFSGTAVEFRYEARPDVDTAGVGERLAIEDRRLKTIDVRTAGRRNRAYRLRYAQSPATGRSLLRGVTEYGTDAVVDAAGTVVSGHALPSVRLRYAAQRPAPERFAGALRRARRAPRWDGIAPRPVYTPGPVVINTDQRPFHDPLHTGDFDGDSRTDGLQMVATPEAGGALTLHYAVRFADGERSATSATFPVQYYRTFAAWTADLNADGRDDLVFLVWKGVPNSDPDAADPRIVGAISDGSGGFAFSGQVQTPPWVTNDLFGSHVPQCQPGDVNGDGRLDLACSFWQSSQTQSLGVALSKGDGTFDLPDPQTVATGRGSRSMTVGDTTGDGLADAFFADFRQAELDACPEVSASCVVHFDLLVAESRGNARFRLRRVPTDWRASTDGGLLVAKPFAADVNGDGRDDYVDMGGATLDDAGKITGGALRLAVTGPDNTFTLHEQSVSKTITEGENIATLGDANGDGRADLMLVTPIAAGAPGCSSAITYRHLLLTRAVSTGSGFDLSAPLDDCSASEELAKPWSQLSTLADIQPSDTNGDGLADFLTGFYDEIDNKTHTFDLQDSPSRATGRDGHRWVPAEIDGDGRQDLVHISSQQGGVVVHSLRRRPNGTYAAHVDRVGQSPNPALANWKVMDIDADGRSDLVRVRCRRPGLRLALCSTEIDTLLSNGDGTWRQKFPFVDVWRGAQIQSPPWRAMDANGDGRDDLVQVTRLLEPSDTIQPGLYIKTYLADGEGGWNGQPLRGPLDVAGTDTAAWRPIDIDGDGRTDLARVEGRALSSGTVRIEVTSLLARAGASWVRHRLTHDSSTTSDGWIDLDAVADARNWQVLDANGDGRGDLVHLARTPDGLRIHTLFSEGTNFGPPEKRNVDLDPDERARLLDLSTWKPADVNGDGRSDLVHAAREAGGVEVETLLSTGGGWRRPSAPPVPDPGTVGNRRSPTWVPADADGDGGADLVRVDVGRPPGGPRRTFVSILRSRARADLLTGVRTPMGGSLGIRYRPSSRYARSDPAHGCALPQGTVLPVTAAITVRDGRSAWADRTRYGYACPHWSQQHRRFLGWSQLSAHQDAAANRPVVRTLTFYDQSDACLTQLQGVALVNADGDFAGGRDIIAPDDRGPAPPYRCRPLYRNHISYGAATGALNAYTYFAYDDYGNVLDVFEHGAAGTAGDERTTTFAYRYATGPWIVALPWQQTLSEGVHPAGKLLRSTFFCYDGDNGTDSTNCSGVPAKGQLTGVQRVDDQGLYVTERRLYDPYGNLAVTQNARHFGTGTFYDQTYHRYPVAVTNALGHSTSIDWDLELGRVKQTTDPNGAATTYRYDRLGRVRRVDAPGGAVIRRRYRSWGDPRRQRIREQIDDGTPDGLWTLTYLDGLGRVYRVEREGAGPHASSVRQTEYSDASRRPYTRSYWRRRAHPEDERVEKFEYDLAGRLVRQTHPDQTTVRRRYDSDGRTTSATTINERQHAKKVSLDAYGRVTEVFERDPGTAQVASVTSTYDAADELLTRTDPNGNVTTNTWDILGRLRRVDDPDLGPRSYTYDLDGNLQTETDARNRTLTYTYDALDRAETKRYPGATTPAVTWHYDEPGHGAANGRLTSVTDPSAAGCPDGRSMQLTYDKAGRTTVSAQCVEGRTETMVSAYDALGREQQLTYPDQETVTYEYDAAGRLARMPGYVDALRYNAAGQYRRIDYANGVSARYRYDGAQRLRRSTLKRAATLLYDARYAYEPNGVIRRIRSSTDSLDLDFVHDELDRLREVTGDHRESFRYDPAGNLQSSSMAATYAYPPQGPTGCPVNGVPAPCRQPHAPTQVTGRILSYERNGGLSSITDTASGASWGIDWNDDHQPSTLIDSGGVQTSYGYNGLGERVSRRRENDVRRYYGPYVVHSSTRGLVKDYFAGSLRVARREAGAVRFQHGDHLGSIRLMTDASGTVVARSSFDAFGARHSSVADPGDRGFAGRRTDAENDLVEMGARDYVPWLGQFASPDTIVPDPLSTQATNRYAYAENSPVSAVDPTGHGPEAPPGISGSVGNAGKWLFNGSSVHNLFPPTIVVLPPPNVSQVRAQAPPVTDLAQTNLGGACSACHVSRFKPHAPTRREWIEAAIPSVLPFVAILIAVQPELLPPLAAAGAGTGAEITVGGGGAAALQLTGSVVAADQLVVAAAGTAAVAVPIAVAMSANGDPGGGDASADLGRDWVPKDINDVSCHTGCEEVAAEIQKRIGGTIHEITVNKNLLPGARALGPYRGASPRWLSHQVVVNGGRVYDAFTGRFGLAIEEYKALWDYADVLNFGF